MGEINARVTGFNYSTHHAYTTHVEVDGRNWSLAIRYSTFYAFHTSLLALEKHFIVPFPPKGGIFFSPPPEERQEQLDAYLLSTLVYFDMRRHPKRMATLLNELLQISQHVGFKDDDEERTASEGSSVAEELLVDTPASNHVVDKFRDQHRSRTVLDSNFTTPLIRERDSGAAMSTTTDELPVELEMQETLMGAEPEEEPEIAIEVVLAGDLGAHLVTQDLTSGPVARDYVAMLRRKTLVSESAVVLTMQQFVDLSIQAAADSKAPIQNIATDALHLEMPLYGEKTTVLGKPTVQLMATAVKGDEMVGENPRPVTELDAAIPAVELALALTLKPIEDSSQAQIVVKSDRRDQLLAGMENVEIVIESSKKVAELEDPIVSSLRCNDPLGLSAVKSAEHDTGVAKLEREQHAAICAEAEEKAQARAAKAKAREAKEAAEAKKATKARAKQAAEAELLRAQWELSRRLKRFRYPIFFQTFGCKIKASRLSLQCQNDGICV